MSGLGHSSKKFPVYANLVDEDATPLGTAGNPLVTSGGGTGGAQKVEITSAGGDATTGQYTGGPNTDIGLTTNARLNAQSSTQYAPLQVRFTEGDSVATNINSLYTQSHNMGFNGTTWDRLHSTSGALHVAQQGVVDTELPAAATLADATANPTTPLIGAALEGFNGTTWDRHYNNIEGTLLASAARTAETASSSRNNYNARGVMVYLDVTAVPGTDTVQLEIQSLDPASGVWATLLTDTAVDATGFRRIALYPSAEVTANVQTAGSLPLPRTWRVNVVHSGAGSFTYSVGYALVL